MPKKSSIELVAKLKLFKSSDERLLHLSTLEAEKLSASLENAHDLMGLLNLLPEADQSKLMQRVYELPAVSEAYHSEKKIPKLQALLKTGAQVFDVLKRLPITPEICAQFSDALWAHFVDHVTASNLKEFIKTKVEFITLINVLNEGHTRDLFEKLLGSENHFEKPIMSNSAQAQERQYWFQFIGAFTEQDLELLKRPLDFLCCIPTSGEFFYRFLYKLSLEYQLKLVKKAFDRPEVLRKLIWNADILTSVIARLSRDDRLTLFKGLGDEYLEFLIPNAGSLEKDISSFKQFKCALSFLSLERRGSLIKELNGEKLGALIGSSDELVEIIKILSPEDQVKFISVVGVKFVASLVKSSGDLIPLMNVLMPEMRDCVVQALFDAKFDPKKQCSFFSAEVFVFNMEKEGKTQELLSVEMLLLKDKDQRSVWGYLLDHKKDLLKTFKVTQEQYDSDLEQYAKVFKENPQLHSLWKAALLKNYIEDRRTSGAHYLHWYGRLFGFSATTKIKAAEAQQQVLLGETVALTKAQQKALNTGRLGAILKK